MTDEELKTAALRALDMLRVEMKTTGREIVFCVWFPEEGLFRMKMFESQLEELAGPGWQNDPSKKTCAFGTIRLATARAAKMGIDPPTAIVIAHWAGFKEQLAGGELKNLGEGMMALAQTEQRVCIASRPEHGEQTVQFFDQVDVGPESREKMFGPLPDYLEKLDT
jgi:hypothetical protein